MDSPTSYYGEARPARSAFSENPLDDAAAESSTDVPAFLAALRGEPVVTKEQLDEFVAAISPQPQYGARAAAGPSIDVEGFVAALRGEPVVTKEQVDEFVAAITGVHEATYDPSKHPRAPKGQPEGGQWVANGGASSAATPFGPFRTAAFQAGQATAQPAGSGGAPSATWPTTGPASSRLPKVGSGAGTGAAVGAGIGAGAFLGGLRNGSMGTYWARVPGTQAMPQIWVYELEKRVRAGTLSRDDAVQIFNTAVLGAEAQGFKPTGDRMSLVHKSAVDFLGKAEAVYFARKKKTADAEGSQAKPERVTGDALAKARGEFERMKPELWKEEARKNPEKYTPEQLASIRQGKTPKDSNGKPLEIHHKKPLSEGGTNTYENFQFGTREDHRIGPNFKKNHPNLPRGRAQ